VFQFWSAYAPCSSQYLDSVQLTLEQIDVIRRLIARYPEHMQFVTTADGRKNNPQNTPLSPAKPSSNRNNLSFLQLGEKTASWIDLGQAHQRISLTVVSLRCKQKRVDCASVDRNILVKSTSDERENIYCFFVTKLHFEVSKIFKETLQKQCVTLG
jgi:hypothetical protein